MKKIIALVTLLFVTISLYGADTNPRVSMKTTQGTIVFELYPKVAPLAVENFETLVADGYYNGTVFHRIIKNFMVQGGDPTATGRGGKSKWNRAFKDEFAPNVVFDSAGILAMANSGRNTNGSQFFITTAPTPWLNGNHTIFGRVVEGMDTLKKLNSVKTARGDRPTVEQKIVSAKVIN